MIRLGKAISPSTSRRAGHRETIRPRPGRAFDGHSPSRGSSPSAAQAERMRACRACTFRASNPRACQDRTKDGSLDVKQQGATRGQRINAPAAWLVARAPQSDAATPTRRPAEKYGAGRGGLLARGSLHDDVGCVDDVDDIHYSYNVAMVELTEDVHLDERARSRMDRSMAVSQCVRCCRVWL
eukprot:scaffold56081_cov27-Tisochrysis_lutea.AAC.5